MKKTLFIAVALLLVSGVVAPVVSADVGYGGGGGGGGSTGVGVPTSGGGYYGGGNIVTPATVPATNSTSALAPVGKVLGVETFMFKVNLRRGMSNQDVVELQNRLASEGYFTFGTSTGYFGPLTMAAVQAYQIKNGISSTGFVGPLTRAALNGTNS